MKSLPTISIVVPSFNQARYLTETLQSLVDQDYPMLEVIIQDGGSNDGSVAIAEDFVRRYPAIFKLYVEKDSGQADALNRGFARTTGQILAFLNSDDTYFPRILHRVAAEIDPARGRYVIMGRCLFTGERSRYVGIEHPAEYVSNFQQLAIWKRGFNTIPQPSVFWHRAVWERCGGLDVNEHHALDYDLFCRFSRHYPFHRIDELFSTYRMHDGSKSSQRTEAEVLELSIKVSRKHWGTWLSPLRWRCEFSYWLHNRQRHERARHHARRAEEALINRRYGVALVEFAGTLINAPRMARDRLFCGWLAARGVRLFERFAVINEGFTGRYTDGWIGPIYRDQVSVPEGGRRVIVTAEHYPQPTHRKIKVQLFINGALADSKVVEENTTFSLAADVESYRGQTVSLEIRTNSCFIPSDVSGGEDRRKLSLHLGSIVIDGEAIHD
jgi:glycosyltransferase involved in cell wall biosynthesis